MTADCNFPPLEDPEIVLEEVLRHTPVGVIVSDLRSTIVDVNPALCAMLGYTRMELVGAPITRFAHPDELPAIARQTAELREGWAGHYVAIRRYVARDGAIVHAKVSASVVQAKTGEPVCGIGFIENITDTVTMESALRDSETRYRRVVEDQTELVVRTLPDGTLTFVNEAYCRYVGLPAEKLLGERPLVQAKFAALSPANPVLTDQRLVTGSGGARRWQEWTDRGFFDEEGRLIEIQSVGRDLTDRYEAQQRLVRSENRHRRLFNSLPIAVWENDWSGVMEEIARRNIATPEKFLAAVERDPSIYYQLGPLVRITAVNPAALAMAGVATVAEFERWLASAATPESAARFSRTVPAIMFGDSKFIMDEYQLIRADGQRIDVLIRIARSERWGEDWMTFPTAIDISDRKRFQLELVHKQELTGRAEAAAQFGSWEWRPDPDLIYGSPGFWRILDGREGGGPAERSSAETIAMLHADDGPRIAELWNRLQQPSREPRQPVLDVEYRLPRPDGSLSIATGRMFLTYAPDGRMIRAFGIVRDITEARRAEEEAARYRDELVRADKMISLGILVSGMAHEINNPNHSIGLNAPLVHDAWREAVTLVDELAGAQPGLRVGRMPWNEARREVSAMLEDIELASERIHDIVAELRGFALDHDPGVRRSVSVNDIVHASLRLLGKHIARATRRFQLDLASDVPPVNGNARRLEQIVVNLVLNACQALEKMDQGISISTGAEGQRVFIRVRDEGRGIAPEHMATIRTPFFTTKRAEGGTGLGVSVSDRIANEHGGELTFESEPGHGATATLWLPVGKR